MRDIWGASTPTEMAFVTHCSQESSRGHRETQEAQAVDSGNYFPRLMAAAAKPLQAPVGSHWDTCVSPGEAVWKTHAMHLPQHVFNSKLRKSLLQMGSLNPHQKPDATE